MTGMEHAIKQVTRVVDGILDADPQIAREMRGDEPDRIARALAEAGLLAPAPLREEWGYLIGTTGYLSVSRKAAENAVTRTRRDSRLNPRLARILMSDWIECETNDE